VKEKLGALYKEYGGIMIGVFLTIWVITFFGTLIAILTGFEIQGSSPNMGLLAALGASWVMLKVTMPVRVIITLALTPLVAKVIRRRAPKKDAPPPSSQS